VVIDQGWDSSSTAQVIDTASQALVREPGFVGQCSQPQVRLSPRP
jgi:hypothetical protein